MPTRARSPKPSLCRHARLANDGAPQEIWHHATGSPTIVRNNIDATDIDDIDNHNNKNKNNNNNNNEEEELHPLAVVIANAVELNNPDLLLYQQENINPIRNSLN
ncbi:hypothetical protein FRACYDRAFT_250305 [Fragilariopsis cylindrus CCMP1102]|uniref:Uncharacterized protein n=1 Tax=Fragilariopsis cylindrus CCMP1102 TaxID=635003 RepID=A0A1E7EQF2_9STRA|nr:hypothetical protein FRACYDRAFT_250305 [Fragilariopsis cylindrus CCMP1102]|eukprot:OEU08084.1 hypothetical protein FRACYDRAFT_250305 [Fragilariopsis cylindrus CCMP1102]